MGCHDLTWLRGCAATFRWRPPGPDSLPEEPLYRRTSGRVASWGFGAAFREAGTDCGQSATFEQCSTLITRRLLVLAGHIGHPLGAGHETGRRP